MVLQMWHGFKKLTKADQRGNDNNFLNAGA